MIVGGIGFLVIASFFILIFNPLLTVILINESGLIRKAKYKSLKYVVIYILKVIIILLLIRNLKYYHIVDWLILYTGIIGLACIYFHNKNVKRTNPNNT